MSNKKESIIGNFLLKILILASLILALIVGFYFIIKANDTKSLAWSKLKPEKNFNLFAFFGWKWNIIFALTLLFFGICYRWPWGKLYEAYLQRKKLLEFAEGVNMAIISSQVGKGKTLLLSILARHLPIGIKKVGFVSNVPDAELLSYNDINFDEPISKMDSFRIPKYFFLDETNFYIDGVEVYKNRIYHRGAAYFLQISRHHQVRLWISATRDNHVWVAVRGMVNYYIRLGGLEFLMNIGSFFFHTLKVQFYDGEELKKEFNILISNLDFGLYDSYWLKDTSYFRPLLTESENRVKHTQPQIENLTDADRKLLDLDPEQDEKIITEIQKTFTQNNLTEKNWDKFVNNQQGNKIQNSSLNMQEKLKKSILKEKFSETKKENYYPFQKSKINKKKNPSLDEFLKKWQKN